MGVFNKDKLRIVFAGAKSLGLPNVWQYSDTGIVGADFSEGSTFFTTGYDCGMRRGDMVLIHEGDTGTYNDSPLNKGGNMGGRRTYISTVYDVTDTGATQTRLNTVTLLGDTS